MIYVLQDMDHITVRKLMLHIQIHNLINVLQIVQTRPKSNFFPHQSKDFIDQWNISSKD